MIAISAVMMIIFLLDKSAMLSPIFFLRADIASVSFLRHGIRTSQIIIKIKYINTGFGKVLRIAGYSGNIIGKMKEKLANKVKIVAIKRPLKRLGGMINPQISKSFLDPLGEPTRA